MTLVLVTAVEWTSPGTVGGVVSPDGGVVTCSVPEGWLTLPAASRAFT